MGDSVVQLSSKGHHDIILSSLQQLRLGGQLIDITVHVDHQGEVEEFQAHQVMLAAYSGYFRRLLLSRDAVPDKLFLSDIHTANFSTFLDFVYTGRAEVARDKLADVRAAAILLDCWDLSEVCVAAMTRNAASEESSGEAPVAATEAQSIDRPSSEADAKKQPRLRGLKRKPPLKGDDVGPKQQQQQQQQQQQPRKKSAKAKIDPSFAATANKDRVDDDLAAEAGEAETPDKEGGRRVSIRLAGRKIPVGVLKRRDIRTHRVRIDLAETWDPDSPSSETDENKTGEEERAVVPQSPTVKDEEKEKSDTDGGVVVGVVARGDEDDDEDDDGEERRIRDKLYLSEDEEDEEEEGGDGKRGRKRTSRAQFECGSCQRTFHYARSYIKHISTYHGVKAEVTYQCETCHQTFANRGNLKIHQKHVHNNERLFSCQVCTKTFKRKKDVIRHQRQVHEGGGQRHICPKCGKTLSSKTALSLHERTHTGAKPFQCTECGAKFSQSSALKMHQRTHTGEKPFACDLCEARFTQKHMLAYHKRSHSGERPFMCEACGKSFASKEYLRHHSNIHTGSRPYKCNECGRGFAQRNSLHQHLKIHTGERPYSCKDCTKQFTQLNALQRHQRIHTGEKPYMCGLCKRTFTDKSTVRRHTMTHATDGPWKNYLVVLERNMEGPRTKLSAKQEGEAPGAEGNQDQAKVHGEEVVATTFEGAEVQTGSPPSEATSIMVPGQPVTLPADWATHGTIALVSHSSLGGITVIHTEMPAGTQLQPIVTTDVAGTRIISLDGSTITVPFALPVSVAHAVTTGDISISTTSISTTADSPSVPGVSGVLTEVPAENHGDVSQPSVCVLEAAVSQTILAQGSEVVLPEDVVAVVVEESGVHEVVSCADQFATEAMLPNDKLVNAEESPSGEELAVAPLMEVVV